MIAPPPWLKLHRRLLEARKMRELPPRLFRTLILAWCATDADGLLVDESGRAADVAALAWRLRLSLRVLTRDLRELVARECVECDADGAYRIHDWADWQVTNPATETVAGGRDAEARRIAEREKKRRQRARQQQLSLDAGGQVPGTVPDVSGTHLGTVGDMSRAVPGTDGGTKGDKSPRSQMVESRQERVDTPYVPQDMSPRQVGDETGDITELISEDLIPEMVQLWGKGGGETLVFSALVEHLSGAPDPVDRLAVIRRNFPDWAAHQKNLDPNMRTPLHRAIREGWFVVAPGEAPKRPMSIATGDERDALIKRGQALARKGAA